MDTQVARMNVCIYVDQSPYLRTPIIPAGCTSEIRHRIKYVGRSGWLLTEICYLILPHFSAVKAEAEVEVCVVRLA